MTGVIRLMAKEFIKWVLIANVFAWPIAWIVMNTFLQKYA